MKKRFFQLFDTGGESSSFFTDGQIAIKDDKINIYRDELYKK
jgi:hypothetical protein